MQVSRTRTATLAWRGLRNALALRPLSISLLCWLRGQPDNGVTLCCVIQGDDVRSLPALAELATRFRVKIDFSCYTPMRTGNRDYMLDPKQVDELEQEINACDSCYASIRINGEKPLRYLAKDNLETI